MMILDIKDGTGKIPVSAMREYFESSINNTPILLAKINLCFSSRDGVFLHYNDEYTQTMWSGFALGMRAAERIQKVKDEAANHNE